MNIIIPKYLKKGDTIGFLSVSGPVRNIEIVENVRNEFIKSGYKIKISDTTYMKKNYLCADDEKRANALNSFFADKEINAIIAIRGGYGAIRILDKIDYDVIKNNPKIVCGYSDITALQLMIYKNTGLVTYNAPMIESDFAKGLTELTQKSFWDAMTKETKKIIIDTPRIYYEGTTEGLLWGGNLSTIQSLCGLDFIPNENFIFFTEDINEPAYKIDKMFTQLLNIPKFKDNIAGIVLGDFNEIDNKKEFEDLISSLAINLKIPIISGLKFGHQKEKKTFPIGVNAILDTHLSKILIK